MKNQHFNKLYNINNTYIIFFFIAIIIIMYYLVGNFSDYKSNKLYYFDNNSTTLIHDDKIKQNILKWLSCGNPSNVLHNLGLRAHNHIEYCRHKIAKKIKVQPNEIYFTSGATESNNIFIQGVIKYNLQNNKDEVHTYITSSFEHPSVINIFKNFQKNKKINIIFINPCLNKNDEHYGCIKPDDIEKEISNSKSKIIMMSIMHINNETGAMQNINEIAKIANKHNIIFHCDTTQSIGKYNIYPKMLGIHSICLSAHKIFGPKGIGLVYIDNKYSNILNLCYGGEQEFNKRPGTENVALISGLSSAFENVHLNRLEKNNKIKHLKLWLTQQLAQMDTEIIGPVGKYASINTLLVVFKNLKICNKKLVSELSKHNIYVSVGSACQTGKLSHVLNAMKINPFYTKKLIRISLSEYNSIDDCQFLINKLKCITGA